MEDSAAPDAPVIKTEEVEGSEAVPDAEAAKPAEKAASPVPAAAAEPATEPSAEKEASMGSSRSSTESIRHSRPVSSSELIPTVDDSGELETSILAGQSDGGGRGQRQEQSKRGS